VVVTDNDVNNNNNDTVSTETDILLLSSSTSSIRPQQVPQEQRQPLLIIHIGPGKTATTTIQKESALNLTEHSVRWKVFHILESLSTVSAMYEGKRRTRTRRRKRRRSMLE
jgi:hypothetical protein